MTTLDPAYCADGCGRLAETERPTADGRREQVCAECAAGVRGVDDEARAELAEILGGAMTSKLLGDPSDHATLEDR